MALKDHSSNLLFCGLLVLVLIALPILNESYVQAKEQCEECWGLYDNCTWTIEIYTNVSNLTYDDILSDINDT